MLPKDSFPLNRPMLTELWCKEMINLGCDLFWILQTQKSSAKIERKKLTSNVFYIIPRFGRKSLVSKIVNIYINFIIKLIFSSILIKKHSIKFIHVHNAPEEGIIALILSKLFKIKFTYAYTSHFLFSLGLPIKDRSSLETAIKKIHNFIRKRLYIIVLKNAALVFPISGYLINRLNSELGLPYNKMLAVPECASSLFLDYPKRKKNKNSNDTKKIVYIGSLGKRRNINFIIDTFRIVNKQYNNVELHLIGWGEREDDVPLLKKYVTKQKLASAIKFMNKIPYGEIPKVLSQFDIGLSFIPPIDIYLLSTPTKCVEYLSLGLPVIANKEIHDQRRLLELSNGGILTNYNIEDAAQGVVLLLIDENLRARCAENGSNWINNNRTFSEIAKSIFPKIRALQN